MPTYNYKCGKCGNNFEKFQGITEAPVRECPDCGGEVARVIAGGSGIIFRGKGFYQTDYKACSDKCGKGSGGNPSCPASNACDKSEE